MSAAVCSPRAPRKQPWLTMLRHQPDEAHGAGGAEATPEAEGLAQFEAANGIAELSPDDEVYRYDRDANMAFMDSRVWVRSPPPHPRPAATRIHTAMCAQKEDP